MHQTDFLGQALRGNQDAVNFCLLLGSISQTWDDLVDEDKHVGGAEVNAAFWNALVALPTNAFYRQHEQLLSPLVQGAITDWMDSNTLALGTRHEKTLSFVLRDRLSSVVVQCALIVGGYNWMLEIGPEIRRRLQAETLEEYLGEDDESGRKRGNGAD